MYFDKNFPVIEYDSVGNGEFKDVKNLLRRVALNTKVKSNAYIYDTYDVKEGETPESIADSLYDDAELHWVIMLVNDITDRYHQWPMSVRAFEEYLSEKYSNPLATHHFEISQKSGDTTVKINIGLDSTGHSGDTVSAVTNREYEENLQTEYSKIRLVRKEFVNQIRKELRTLLQSDG